MRASPRATVPFLASSLAKFIIIKEVGLTITYVDRVWHMRGSK
jgi:hypothetical protein